LFFVFWFGFGVLGCSVMRESVFDLYVVVYFSFLVVWNFISPKYVGVVFIAMDVVGGYDILVFGLVG
jgi:hypothetical protein